METKTVSALAKTQTIILLRWVLVIATSYLVLFSRPLHTVPPSAAVFVAAYLASNLLLNAFLERAAASRFFESGVVLFDTLAISAGLVLTNNVSTEFFLLYFLVILMGAITGRPGLLVGAALLISGVHAYTVSRFVGTSELLAEGHLLRFPFLFVVALFFGYLVDNIRRIDDARTQALIKMDFYSAITHDLKQPLHTIQLMSEALLGSDMAALHPPQVDLVRRIHASTRRVITLALNFLDASRVEAGRLQLNRTPTQLGEITADAVAMLRSASELKKLAIDLDIESDLPAQSLDMMQIERVVSNVLDNAVKYTPEGGRVTVAVRRSDDAVVLTVIDSGPGFPPDEIPRLLEKYRRHAGTNGVEGSGLGLFIVKALVEAHEGRLEVGNEPDRGARIRISLPSTSRHTAAKLTPIFSSPRRTRLLNRTAGSSPRLPA